MRKLVRATLAAALVLPSLAMMATVAPTPADAAVAVPMFKWYDKAMFGDFVIAGNVVTSCPTSAARANPNCAVGRNTSSSTLTTAYINDVFYMEYVDVDGDDSTFNSSTARITIPPGATIDYARLWWMGNTGSAVRTPTPTPYFACNAAQPNNVSPNLATAPTGFPNAAFTPSTHPIKFKIAGGTPAAASYQNLTPEAGRFYQDVAPTVGGRHYATSQDIKAILSAQPTGVPLDVTVGNIWTPKGNNCTGGFAITYVFKYPAAEPTYAPQVRQVLIFDGFVAQGAADAPTITNLTGFTLANGTRRLGVGIIEGDQGITGDKVLANGVALTEPRITPGTTTNFNASTTDGAQNPVYLNTYGLDAKTMEVPASVLPAGLTNVPLTFTTSGDQYFPFLFAFSAPVTTNYLAGTVWHDIDGDGVAEGGEPGIPGTLITLTGTDVFGVAVTRTTTTNAGGGYRFDDLLNGTYTVTETQPSAYANSPGTTTTQYVSNVRTPFTFSGTTPVGITDVNFAEIQSSISGFVYHDQNADGTNAADPSDPGIAGVTVYLTGTDINGATVGLTTTTGTDGSYRFANLAPGTYTVTEVQPLGWGDGLESVGSVGGTTTTNDKVEAIVLAAGTAATGYNFGEKKAGLSGIVYVDTNNDGVQGAVATEPGIAGVTITVTGLTEAGAPVNVSTTTDSNGAYSFPTLLPGTYTVTETQPVAYGDGQDAVGTVNGTATGTGSNDQVSNIVLTGAGSGVAYNFGELPGTISGRVFYDADKDSALDPTETGIGGVTITLTLPGGATRTTTTATDGTYSFTGLPAGNYTITETQPAGYGSSLEADNLISAATLPAGGNVTNQNFGETLSTISGKVYIDSDALGSFTVGEPGIANTTITLRNAAGTVIATTTTDSAGNYTFTGLTAGTYSVVETQPPFMTDGAETAGSPVNGNTTVNDTISSIVVGAGADLVSYNFGERGATISGKVYVDLNNNGIAEANEPGIPGVTLTVEVRICMPGYFFPISGATCGAGTTMQWAPWDSVTSGADGSYISLGAAAGAPYRIIETQPAAYSDGIDTPGTLGSIQANDILQIGALNFSSVLTAAGSANNNFGELAGEISGFVYYDDENDGLRTGDTAIAGTVVTLTDGTNTWTAITDATGAYRFVGLPISAAGVSYTINETQPSTYFDGLETSPGTTENPGGVNDRIGAVVLTTAARTSAENNFGERLGTISGQIWYDANKDGVKDAGETTGIPSTIIITNGAGTVVWTGPTNADGTYTSIPLPPGSYTVTETQPTGYGSSTTNAVAVNLDSVAVTGVNFGETLGSLAGSVYVDTNKNGALDAGEGPIGGVTVTLTPPAGVDAGAGPGVAVSTTTDLNGEYVFDNLLAADYTIAETQPTTYNDGSETIGTTGGTITGPDSFTAVSLAPGEDAVGYLFGEHSPSVSGTVYVDLDRDGVQDADEVGIPGVEMHLTGPGGVDIIVTTDINGDYVFPSVPVDTGYTITQTQPVGYGSSEQPTSIITDVNVPLAGVTEQNFGETLSTLKGTVYIDGNNNGVQDVGELGIAGATVNLIGLNDAGQAVSLTTTTNASGDYTFTGLLAGTYTVEEPQPANFDDGKDASGTVDAGATGVQDSWADPDRFASVEIGIEDDGVEFNFGEIGTSIAGTVFRDKAKDGDYDPGTDTPLGGQTVELFAADGTTPIATTTTLPDGSYFFGNLPIGTYVVKETQPVGYADTIGAAGPNTRTVVAPAGGIGGIDFGETLASIGGTVWVDYDKDGVRDGTGDPIVPPTDAGIAGVVVKLYDSTGTTELDSTVTDANGEYFFDDLLPGTYVVKETQPAEYNDGVDLVGSLGGSAATNDVLSGIVITAGAVGTDYDFAEHGMKVSGTVWLDRDQDGVIDGTEPGRLANITITLSDGDPVTPDPTTTTDSTGYYEFTGVPAGDYTIIETQPANYVSTLPVDDEIPITVVLADLANQNFGEVPGALGDLIWNDVDGDGEKDATEPGIPGVEVTISSTIDGEPVTFTTVTDATGKYEFNDFPLGTWTVTVDSTTLPGGLTPTFDADDEVTTPHESTVTLDSAHLIDLGQDFGYRGAGALGNFVWNDQNNDGVQDLGEPGIPGVKVTATVTVAGTVLTYTTTTNASGGYSFTGIPYGDYTVTVDTATLPVGMTQTYDANGIASPHASTVTLDADNPANQLQDFGYRGTGSIGDKVWVDLDADGALEAGEPGLPNTTITVTTVINGTTVTYTTTTDANGNYTVSGLPTGDFIVTVTPPTGMSPTFDFNGTTTPNTSAVTLTSGTPTNTAQDFGYNGAGTIGDLIWNDLNGDGMRTTDEPGIPGVKVTAVLTVGGLPVTFTTTTDANGGYLFTNLPYGTYTITVDSATLPLGLTQTGDPDGTEDNTSTVTLNAGAPQSLVQDFGYQGAGSIGDFIWNDLDGDGVQESGEPGIPGVKVTVTTTIAGSPVTYTATTNATGTYTVSGIPYAAYTVTVDTATIPIGMTQTFDSNGVDTPNASTVTLNTATPTSAAQDFGYKGDGALGDLVWLDLDGDTTVDAGEPGINAIKVTATTVINGTTVNYVVTTNAAGAYNLVGLPVGTYTVAVDPATLPTGSVATADFDGLATLHQSVIELTAATPTNTLQDFGYKGPGSIGDRIWNDLDGDGVQESGEPGIPGVKVTATATVNGTPVTLTTTTGSTGLYSFVGLPLVEWTITVDPFTLPGGMTQTGDPDITTDNTSKVTLTALVPTNDAQDFGYNGIGEIGDYVWIDVNADGVQDATESGIAGVGITLTTTIAGSPVTYTTTTGPTGLYGVTGLPLGAYTVAVTPATVPAGATQTYDATGALDNSSAVTLTLAIPANSAQDFGYKGPGSIGDRIWNDLDGDGAQDPGEPGIPGVKVTATTVIDGVIYTFSTTTGPDGSYTIDGLPLSTFTVTVDTTTLPAGMTPTGDPDALKNGISTVTLNDAAKTSTTQDFGYQGVGALGNFIWNDQNGDGLQDPNEPGIPGVDVTVTVTIAGSLVTYTTITNSTGHYGIAGLPVGTFTVAVDTADLPTGMVQTFDNDGIVTTANKSTIALTLDLPTNELQDFGYRGPGTIGDTIYNDLNSNGTQDAGEPGIPGVDVIVTTTINTNPVTYTATTNANGTYTVPGLPEGTFTVNVQTADLPNPLTQTGDPDTTVNNSSTVTLGGLEPLVNNLQDFGYQGPGEIGDTIWLDVNGNASHDAGEPGIPGVKVTITTTINGTTVTYTDTTDANGVYGVSGLPIGTYTITVDTATIPPSLLPTYDDNGIATANVSIATLTVPVPKDLGQDFGYEGPGAIGDTIYNDLDGNGSQNPGEPGIPGVEVTVETTINSQPVTVTVTTDADGNYTVPGLPIGDYTVTVDPDTLPGGVLPIGDFDLGADNTSAVTLGGTEPVQRLDQDFGYQGPGSIGDTVFNDLNGNGDQDAGEPGLPGVEITITTVIDSATVTYTTTTGPDGGYTVSGLPLGVFTVTVDPLTLPEGLTTTGDFDGKGTPNTSEVILGGAEPAANIDQDFAYQGPGSIGDTVWNDQNGNMEQDPGEPGLPGVTVTLTVEINGETVTYSDNTDAFGHYLIDGLPYGDYTVTVDTLTLPGGVVPTFDSSGIDTPHRSTVTLDADHQDDTLQDFGYKGPGVIGDTVFNDLNGDGIQNSGEPGIPGVIVTLEVDINGTTVTYTTTTDATGWYEVIGLPLGIYNVTVDPDSLPLGLLPTGDFDDGNDHTSIIELTVDVPTNSDQDFAYQGQGTIGDTVFNDLNGDGDQDLGEPGLPGVEVVITTVIDGKTVTYSDITDADGKYLVDGLPHGSFAVVVTAGDLPPGLLPTADPDATKNGASTVVLAVGATENLAQDFGYQGPGAIGNFVWNDQNGDGIQDATEPGIPGITMTVTTMVNGTLVTYSDVTDADGHYGISGLPLGDFAVTVDVFDLPGGVAQTGDPDDTKDHTSEVTLAAGGGLETNVDQDFGYQGPGSIGDTIFNDQNLSGSQDLLEPGLPGIDVTITTVINGETVTYTTMTGPDGKYTVNGLPFGDYTVTVDSNDLPASITPTADPDGLDTPHVSLVSLTDAATAVNVDQDFGYNGPGSIGDFIWNDLNGDGVQDAGEPGIPGIDVTVTAVVNGKTVTWSTTTGPDGGYEIVGLPTGTFTVRVDTADLPGGMSQTGDPDETKNNSSTVTLTTDLPFSVVEDFGYQGPGSIGDTVFNDQNGNGTQDPGEPGLPGVVITMTTVVNDETVTYTTSTGPDGKYIVSGLPLGEFTVTVDPLTLPAGVEPTGDGDDPASPPVTPHVSVVTLGEGTEVNPDQDFAYQGPGSIGDTVFNDQNGNGTQDPGEPGLPGVVITMTTVVNDETVTYTTSTGPDGKYIVSGLPLGEFTVTVDPLTLPAGVEPTADPDETKDGVNVVTLTVEVPTTETVDFGYQGPGVIGDTVFNDLDGDGVQDPGEPGIPGVDITITTVINDETVTYTATTDPDGKYEVSGLPLGEFTVTVDATSLAALGLDPTADGDDPVDPADPTLPPGTPNTSVATLTETEPTDDTQDFGYQGPGSIGDIVWDDLNGDGVVDPDEPGYPNVAITITTVINGEIVTYPTTTDPDGKYTVSGLPYGDYTVTVDPTTLPDGVVPSADPNGIDTPNTAPTTLTEEAPTVETQDFGYYTPASIGDLIWDDLNGDGLQGSGCLARVSAGAVHTTAVGDGCEPGLDGVTVTLTGTDGLGEPVSMTATTIAGIYLFEDLRPGEYTVTVTTPDGMVLTATNEGTDAAVDSNGLTTTLTVTSGDATLDVDTGFYTPVSIEVVVYADYDDNGAADPTDGDIVDVPVQLTGVTGAGDPITIDGVTDEEGKVSFPNLPPGTYQVAETQPELWKDSNETEPEVGGDTTTNDEITAITLTSGDPLQTAYFGEKGWNVSGTVTLDDGTPVKDVEITIKGVDELGNPVDKTVKTDDKGNYSIPNVPPGDYKLVEKQPSGLGDGKTVPTNEIPLTVGGGDVTKQDFSEKLGSISGVVFVDPNKNGVIDGNEKGLPGVSVTLTGTDVNGNPVTKTVTTDSNGKYTFPDLVAGTYQIKETQPSGYQDASITVGSAGGTASTNTIGSITLDPGENATGYLFGERKPVNLPKTGSDIGFGRLSGGLAVALGAGLVIVARRRRRLAGSA